jgi:hypothetical protein
MMGSKTRGSNRVLPGGGRSSTDFFFPTNYLEEEDAVARSVEVREHLLAD